MQKLGLRGFPFTSHNENIFASNQIPPEQVQQSAFKPVSPLGGS